jgi:glycosyltransferase involved in cell wall biosynthesis
MTAGPRALYLCYFGLREPLVQTQVLPYLRELMRGGTRMWLLTFEPELRQRWTHEEIERWRRRLRDDGIEWHMLPYHKRPSLPATLYDVVRGAIRATGIVRRERIDILHARSHVAAVVGALVKRLTGARLIFDFRGFLAEEYVDSGNWRANGILYKLAKAAERRLYRDSDAFVVLTERAKALLFSHIGNRPVEVIPCCVSEARFAAAAALDRDALRAELGLSGRVVFVYAGALGGFYMTQETAELFAVAREADPRVYALVLTQGSPAAMVGALERLGFTRNDYRVMKAAPDDVPKYLRAADVALSLARPSYARQAASPTKFAEYLAAGLPVISTRGVGDLDTEIEQARVGVLLDGVDRAAFAGACREVEELRRDPALPERCRHHARTRYDLETVGGERYRRLYRAVLQRTVSTSRVRVLALATYPVEAASSRYRIVQFIEPLRARGIDLNFVPFLDRSLYEALYERRTLLARLPVVALRALRRVGDAFRSADIVFVQREAMLFGPPLIEWLATRLRRRPLVLDLDDATYIAYVSPVYGRLATLLKWPSKTNRLIDRSRVVTCGNPNIAAHVRARGANAVVIPTVVDLNVFHPAEHEREVPVVGWIGSHGTSPFLERLLPMLEELAAEVRYRLTIVGSGRREIRVPGVEVDQRPWRMHSEAEDFRSLDLGLYPIADDAWSAGKSGLKAVQYMASGVPFVMSPVGVCATMGIAGETHSLATTDAEWLAALRCLIVDAPLRATMGKAGRAFAERHYSLEQHADALAAVLQGAAS